jgi:glycosyltransferase involved in cell wall biosynthesis
VSPPLINIVIPVYNEEKVLASSITQVTAFLKTNCPYPHELVIAENGSSDRTLAIARELAAQDHSLHVLHLDQKGRGGAIKTAWLASKADILTYMDVDLSTDLSFFLPLITPLIKGEADLSIGSRLLDPTLTKRCLKREAISRAYNTLVKCAFHTHFSDAQCGFKAITRAAAHRLLPNVADKGWFMDTELLLLAHAHGYRIYDLPVRWVEDADSRVKLFSTAMKDLQGLFRVWLFLRRGMRSN